jgi:hypothetical protein
MTARSQNLVIAFGLEEIDLISIAFRDARRVCYLVTFALAATPCLPCKGPQEMINSRKAVLALLLIYTAGVLTPSAYEGVLHLVRLRADPVFYELLVVPGLSSQGRVLGGDVIGIYPAEECQRLVPMFTKISTGPGIHAKPYASFQPYCAALDDYRLKRLQQEARGGLRDTFR